MLLSVIVPCYNESETIDSFYDMVLNFFKDKKIKYELIMIDDGSTDNTFDKLKVLNEKDKNVKVIMYYYGLSAEKPR